MKNDQTSRPRSIYGPQYPVFLFFPRYGLALNHHSIISYFPARPCKIVEMSTSKTGKHGHAKVHMVAIDIFTGKPLICVWNTFISLCEIVFENSICVWNSVGGPIVSFRFLVVGNDCILEGVCPSVRYALFSRFTKN